MERSRADVLTESLELVAERLGDPAPLVYARLFAERPEMEPLFWRDTGGLVRGQMLSVVLESLMDLAAGPSYAPSLLQSERINHESMGVTPEVFESFLGVVGATFRERLGPDWTAEMDAVWRDLAAEAVAAMR